MLNKKHITVIVQICTVLLLFFSFRIIISILFESNNTDVSNTLELSSIKKTYTSSNLIDSALSEKIVPVPFEFKQDVSSPFSLLNAKPVNKRSTSKKVKSPIIRKKVFLKGILDKKNALALLEDEQGKTFICKIGDHVYNWTVVEIEDQQVVIKDGTYKEVLKVKGR